MKQITILIGVLTCICSYGQPQSINEISTNLKPTPISATFIGFRNTPSIDLNWQPTVQGVASKNESEEQAILEKIKETKNKLKTLHDGSSNKLSNSTSTCPAPVLGTNFQGINNNGNNWPLDNTIAISNGGNIVTCVNSMVQYRSTSGAVLYSQSLYAFINPASGTLISNLCDPKVLYDVESDRFIFFCQTCDGDPANSKIVIGFSKSNNPSTGWWFYTFSGNPYNDGSWFDYPKMAVSSDELFVTGNLFFADGTNNESVIYQIDKNAGYSGAGSLPAQTWNGISGSPFTLVPAGTGSAFNVGPEMYFVATNAVTSSSNAVKLYKITDVLSASNEQMYYYALTSPLYYSSPADAFQLSGAKQLSTGDCRSQSAFIMNNVIHFVFSADDGSNYSNIYYERIDLSNNSVTATKLGSVGYDYCYPAITSAGTTMGNKSATIIFSKSGSTMYPATKAVNCDHNFQWSSELTVKSGVAPISYPSHTGSTERWGDYSGISRQINQTNPTVWVSGDYSMSNGTWGQWIAQLLIDPAISVKELDSETVTSTLYPNPAYDFVSIEFYIDHDYDNLNISIIDVTGKLIKELYNDKVFKGKNVLTFNKLQLSSGIYFVKIYNKDKTFKNEKIIIN